MEFFLASPGAGTGAVPAGTRSFTHDARGNQITEDRPGTNDVTVGVACPHEGGGRLCPPDQLLPRVFSGFSPK